MVKYQLTLQLLQSIPLIIHQLQMQDLTKLYLKILQVQLNGSGFDADGDELTFTWTQKSGAQVEVTQAGTSLSLTSPAGLPNKTAAMVFELLVEDGFGGSDTDTVSVRVVAGNNGPTANAGPDQAVDEGAEATLTCTGSDPDGDPIYHTIGFKYLVLQ